VRLRKRQRLKKRILKGQVGENRANRHRLECAKL
jgi:hypothetical protein